MNIKLSPKHGVNPTLGICYYCHHETGEVGLLGRLPDDREAPRHSVLDREPCARCRNAMERGVMIVERRPGEEERGAPILTTGNVWVMAEDAIRQMLKPPEFAEQVITNRMAFVTPETARIWGLHNGTPSDQDSSPWEARS
jgi:hypothetical protein